MAIAFIGAFRGATQAAHPEGLRWKRPRTSTNFRLDRSNFGIAFPCPPVRRPALPQPLVPLRPALVYFDQAARHGSIRAAAQALNIASSAVNRQILQLEAEVGTPLLERLPRGVRPTAAGEVLLAHIRRWSREATLLRQELGRLRGGVRGTIRIAAGETITEEVLPGVLADLAARYPLMDYSVIAGDNRRITADLLAREADVVVAFDVRLPVRADVVHTVESPLGVICTPDHPLGRRRQATLADCAPWPLVAPGRDWLASSGLANLFEGLEGPGRIVARAERPGILKALVRAGLGIAFLTRLGVERDVAEGRLAWVPFATGIIPPARISVMLPQNRTQPVSLVVFIDLLRRALTERTTPPAAPPRP
jgi:DNA-binding transcriptional LysR family regulator